MANRSASVSRCNGPHGGPMARSHFHEPDGCTMSWPIRRVRVLQGGSGDQTRNGTAREPLNKPSMNCVVAPIVMIARKATQVVAVATKPRGRTRQARDWGATLAGQGLVGELLRCSDLRIEQPCASPRALHFIPQSRCRSHVGFIQRFLRNTAVPWIRVRAAVAKEKTGPENGWGKPSPRAKKGGVHFPAAINHPSTCAPPSCKMGIARISHEIMPVCRDRVAGGDAWRSSGNGDR